MMLPSNRVLAAVGRGGASPNLLAYAAREAAARGTVLELLHVIPAESQVPGPLPLPRRTRQSIGVATLERAALVTGALAPHVPVVLTLASGPPAEVLLNRTEHAGLVVLGAPRGLAVTAGLTSGSLVTEVALAAPCPVTVVPGGRQGEPRVHEVRVGLKWPPHRDARLLDEAFAAAERWRCPLEVLHASGRQTTNGELALPDSEEAWVPGLTALIEDRLVPLRRAHPGVHVRVDVLVSTSAEALVAAARPGAMVLLSRTDDWAQGRLLGPTTRGLLHHARCPVEIVPIAGAATCAPERRRAVTAPRAS